MEIDNQERAVPLKNFELLLLLNELKGNKDSGIPATLIHTTTNYLKSSMQGYDMKAESIIQFDKFGLEIGLNKDEITSCINIIPKNIDVLISIITDYEKRFSNQTLEDILAKLNECFPKVND